MDIFDLQATLSLNTQEFDSGLSESAEKASSFGDVLKGSLAAEVPPRDSRQESGSRESGRDMEDDTMTITLKDTDGVEFKADVSLIDKITDHKTHRKIKFKDGTAVKAADSVDSIMSKIMDARRSGFTL
jgi:hypothetical protein